LFAAIELDDLLHKRLAKVAQEFGRYPGVRWVKPENMHLTLRFFGECSRELAVELKKNLEDLQRPAAFQLPFSGLRFLPNDRLPRVFMASGESPRALLDFQSRIEHAARAVGLTPESRPFVPHITVGRVRDPRQARRLVEAVQQSPRNLGTTECRGFCLFESKLGPVGPSYSKLGDFSFPRAG
jgi:2'-5' RNA ligase